MRPPSLFERPEYIRCMYKSSPRASQYIIYRYNECESVDFTQYNRDMVEFYQRLRVKRAQNAFANARVGYFNAPATSLVWLTVHIAVKLSLPLAYKVHDDQVLRNMAEGDHFLVSVGEVTFHK